MNHTLFFRQKLLIVVVFCIGILLLYFATFRIRASLNYIPANGVVKRYYQETRRLEIDFERLIMHAQKSIELQAKPEYFFTLGLIQYWQYQEKVRQNRGIKADRVNMNKYLKLSLNSLINSLQQSPVQPMAWFLVALMQHHLQKSAKEVRASLEMSMLTGRMSRVLFLPRISLGLQYLDNSSGEFRSLVYSQLKLAERFEKQDLQKLLNNPYYLDKIKAIKHSTY